MVAKADPEEDGTPTTSERSVTRADPKTDKAQDAEEQGAAPIDETGLMFALGSTLNPDFLEHLTPPPPRPEMMSGFMGAPEANRAPQARPIAYSLPDLEPPRGIDVRTLEIYRASQSLYFAASGTLTQFNAPLFWRPRSPLPMDQPESLPRSR